MGLAILLALIGGVAGYMFAPRIAGGIAPKSGAVVGSLGGLIVGAMFRTLFQIALIAAFFLIAWFVWQSYVKKKGI